MIRMVLKRGAAELAILSLLEEGQAHGYKIARGIEERSGGSLRFTLAALYPLLYRMETQGWIKGVWSKSDAGRRRRCYKLLPRGKRMLAPLRTEWAELFNAMRLVGKVRNA